MTKSFIISTVLLVAAQAVGAQGLAESKSGQEVVQSPSLGQACGVFPDSDKPGGTNVASNDPEQCTGNSTKTITYLAPANSQEGPDESTLLVRDYLSGTRLTFSDWRRFVTLPISFTLLSRFKGPIKKIVDEKVLLVKTPGAAPAVVLEAYTQPRGSAFQNLHWSDLNHEAAMQHYIIGPLVGRPVEHPLVVSANLFNPFSNFNGDAEAAVGNAGKENYA